MGAIFPNANVNVNVNANTLDLLGVMFNMSTILVKRVSMLTFAN